LAELEEAWIVFALVREDGLSQAEAANLLGRHKSWVHRRLALLERLCEEGREDLRLGLLSVTAARQFVRLPAGNQSELLPVWRREQLSARELSGTVDLLLVAGRGDAAAGTVHSGRPPPRAEAGARLPMPQPGSSTVASAGTPRRAMASWVAEMTVGDV
jgi:hypothetical protein